jgi:phosphoribosyl 1,2-cyclic phosphodiesterase
VVAEQLILASLTGGGGVGDIKFHIINAQAEFQVSLLGGGSVKVTPLPVHHGNVKGWPFECLGFRIDTLSYVSDCHYIPSSTAKLMAGSQVITLDALNRE